MITISKRLFSLIVIGLATMAVASLSSILSLPMHQAILAFLVIWIGLVVLFHSDNFFTSPNDKLFPGGRTKQQ